jgi:methionyl-tRNA formyltransferase
MKIIFFGSSEFVVPIIKVLKENFELSLVVTTEKAGGAVPSYCQQNKISFISASNLKNKDLRSSILNLKSSMAVVADFGLIIPEDILNAFPKGIINIHPSLLPKYRGPTPVQTAILQGDKITGVSIIKLDKEIDHGPILGQVQEEILSGDTAETLYKRLFTVGANLLLKVLDKYLRNNLKLIAQNHEKATFTKSLVREDGYVDINKLPTKEKLNLMIRAYFPWPGIWTRLRLGYGGQAKLKIVKFLPENKIQVEGKKAMSYKDFLNGYPEGKEMLKDIS